MTVVLHGLNGLRAAAGAHLGTSDWLTVDQATIDRFADATGDHNWIHVDPVRAATDSPVGRTIAHGYGTLALIPVLFESMLSVRDIGVQLNYGLNRMRFPAPVPVDSRIRLDATLAAVQDIDNGVQLLLAFVVEIEDQPKPACVAEAVFRYYAKPSAPREETP